MRVSSRTRALTRSSTPMTVQQEGAQHDPRALDRRLRAAHCESPVSPPLANSRPHFRGKRGKRILLPRLWKSTCLRDPTSRHLVQGRSHGQCGTRRAQQRALRLGSLVTEARSSLTAARAVEGQQPRAPTHVGEFMQPPGCVREACRNLDALARAQGRGRRHDPAGMSSPLRGVLLFVLAPFLVLLLSPLTLSSPGWRHLVPPHLGHWHPQVPQAHRQGLDVPRPHRPLRCRFP